MERVGNMRVKTTKEKREDASQDEREVSRKDKKREIVRRRLARVRKNYF